MYYCHAPITPINTDFLKLIQTFFIFLFGLNNYLCLYLQCICSSNTYKRSLTYIKHL